MMKACMLGKIDFQLSFEISISRIFHAHSEVLQKSLYFT